MNRKHQQHRFWADLIDDNLSMGPMFWLEVVAGAGALLFCYVTFLDYLYEASLVMGAYLQ